MMAKANRTYSLISADSHVLEPPDLWDKWLDKKYQDRAPKLVKDSEGGDAWLYDPNGQPAPLGLVSWVGPRYDKGWTGVRYGHEIHPSCYDGQARLEALDVDGVDAEILYPPARAATTFMSYESEAQLAGLHAFNRWMSEGFCSADPERLLAAYVLPNLGLETSVAEVKRAKDHGFRSVLLGMWPTGSDRLSREDEPFWAAAEELEMPVNIHFRLASQRDGHKPAEEASAAVGAAAGITGMPLLMLDLIFSGVFDRHPKLKVVAVETGVGWIPHFLEMMDDRYWRNRVWAKMDLNKLPSQYFKDNWMATFISGTDRIGVQTRHAVGLKSMAWSTDFPHHGNDWPHSRKVVEELFTNVPVEERDRIIWRNAAETYGLV